MPELYCPACRVTFEVDDNDGMCYADDVGEGGTTPCPGCHVELKVVADVEVYLSATIASELDQLIERTKRA